MAGGLKVGRIWADIGLEAFLDGKLNLVGWVDTDNGINRDNGANDGIDVIVDINVIADVGAISG